MPRDKSLPSTVPDDDEAVAAFLQKVAQTPAPVEGRGRLIFALDATASRERTWDRACHLQSEMFEVTRGLGGLEVQLVFFRGFGECKSSRWTRDAGTLGQMMRKVRCHAGQTQIGKVIAHALKESEREKVSALVYVGDSFEEDVDHVAVAAGKLGVHGTPLFAFHEGGDPLAANAFRHLTHLTGGAYCPFDMSSAERLKELLAAVAVYASGGLKSLSDYSARRGGEALRLTHQLQGGR